MTNATEKACSVVLSDSLGLSLALLDGLAARQRNESLAGYEPAIVAGQDDKRVKHPPKSASSCLCACRDAAMKNSRVNRSDGQASQLMLVMTCYV